MADKLYISKVKLPGASEARYVKDDEGRTNLATLVGSSKTPGEAVLGTAAWENTASAVTESGTGLPTVGAVKSYVDAQIGTINKFDIEVCAAEASKIPAGAKYKQGTTEITGTMAAAATTMYKIYLVQNDDAGAGTYIEYITIRSGAEGSYTYTWEQIGSTKADLTGYAKTSEIEEWKVAGVSFGSDHEVTKADLEASTALDLKALAHKDSASGTYDKVSSITMNKITVSGSAAVTTTSTAASLTKAAYTPAGTVTGSATASGTVAVQLKDAAAATSAAITYGSYTPAGTIAATEGGDFDALKTATFQTDPTNGVQIEGTVTAPSINITASTTNVLTGISAAAVAPTFSEGAFTAATWTGSSYTAPTWSGADYTAPSLGTATTSSFAIDGVTVAIGSSAAGEEETLIFTAASAASAVTAQGTFSAGNVSFGTFNAGSVTFGSFTGGSKAADTFTAGSAATFNSADVLNGSTTAALANAPVFTGSKYAVATTSDKALKTVAFAGTSANIKATKVEYLKQEVSAATFTGAETAITATFAGTSVSDALVTAVTYDKANTSAAFSVDVTPTVSEIKTSSATVTVE